MQPPTNQPTNNGYLGGGIGGRDWGAGGDKRTHKVKWRGALGDGRGGVYIGEKPTHTHPPQPQPVLQTAGEVRPCRRNLTLIGPRNQPLKFGQNWTSNSWDIAELTLTNLN